MSSELEEELRRRLHDEAADVAPFVVGAGALSARARARSARRRALLGGGMAAVVAFAAWTASARGGDRGGGVVAVSVPSAETAGPQGEPQPVELLRRSPDDDSAAQYAQVRGVLTVSANGCLVVADNARAATAVWGSGWTADRQGGRVVIYDAGGRVFAREGEPVGLAGGFLAGAAADRYAGTDCAQGPLFLANDFQAVG